MKTTTEVKNGQEAVDDFIDLTKDISQPQPQSRFGFAQTMRQLKFQNAMERVKSSLKFPKLFKGSKKATIPRPGRPKRNVLKSIIKKATSPAKKVAKAPTIDHSPSTSGTTNEIPSIKPPAATFRIVPGKKPVYGATQTPNSMPDISLRENSPLPSADTPISPIKIHINYDFAPCNDPRYGKVHQELVKHRGNGKRCKHFCNTSTQTDHGAILRDPRKEYDRYIYPSLFTFFDYLQRGKPLEEITRMPYLDPPASTFPHRAPCNPLRMPVPTSKNVQSRMQINTKAKIPTSRPQYTDLPKKPFVPIGSAVAQPLSKKDDTYRLGQFKDNYNFPQKITTPVNVVAVRNVEKRKNTNELEHQNKKIRRETEIELFGSVISDDEKSRASTPDTVISRSESVCESVIAEKLWEEINSKTPAKPNETDTISLTGSPVKSPHSISNSDGLVEKTDLQERSCPGLIPLSKDAPVIPSLEIPNFIYLNKMRNFFCKNYIKMGKCGFLCPDFKCWEKMQDMDLNLMKDEMKLLNPLEMKEIYAFCCESHVLFNHFFPTVSCVMGSMQFRTELISSIEVCERPLYDISYYKWVVNGLIRSHVPTINAINILLDKKTLNTVEAMATILDIIIQNDLLLEFFKILPSCAAMPGFPFTYCLVRYILEFVYHHDLVNCGALCDTIVTRMTDDARAELNLDGDVKGWLIEIWDRQFGDNTDYDESGSADMAIE